MSRLRPEKLHVTFKPPTGPEGPIVPRVYTLTHSDLTGELFLTIGPVCNREQISGLYVRIMRDEVLAEWKQQERGPVLHVHCHVSGGLALGPPRMRLTIFRRELPLVLEALRHGDRVLFEARPALDQAPVKVHFHAAQRRYDQVEPWGVLADHHVQG